MESVCRIMIIDDEFIMRQGIRFMMRWEEEGYVIAGEASNGKEALDLIPALKPHIILCDIAMPVMNGLDFIKIVNREYPDIKLVVLSSYDNFEYVREALVNGAVDYVLKPTLNPEELLKIVSRAAKKVPDLELKRKAASSADDVLETYLTQENGVHAEAFQGLFPHSCYRLFLLPLCYRDGNGIDMSPVLYEKVESFLKGITYCSYLKFLRGQETLCVVLNYSVKDDEKLIRALEVFMGQLGLISERVLGVLGVRHMRMEELKREYHESEVVEKEIFYNRGMHLYKKETGAAGKMPWEKFDFRKFTSFIAVCKYHEAIELYRSYIYGAANNQMQEFKLKNQTKNLLYNLIGSCEEHIRELEEIRREYFVKIEQVMYCDDFLAVFDEMLYKLEEVMVNTEDDQNVYLGKILDYIQEHYAEELNLQSLAEEFNFSYSYLSAYFNQHISEGFSGYLNHIRIQKACEFLERSNLSIAQIGSAVGYADQSYFCRVFKKATGSTPSMYRRGIR